MARVSSIGCGNYRCLDCVTIEPVAKVNILVGKNNTGKSSVLLMLRGLPLDPFALHGSVGFPKESAHTASGDPFLTITTRLEPGDYPHVAHAVFQPVYRNMPEDEKANKADLLAKHGVLSHCRWTFGVVADGKDSVCLKSFEAQMLPDLAFAGEVNLRPNVSQRQESQIVLPQLQQLKDHITLGSPSLDDLRRLLGENQRPLSPVKSGLPIDEAFTPHWESLVAFLSARRGVLEPYRHGMFEGGANTTDKLDPNAANIGQRVYTCLNRELGAGRRIKRFVEDHLPNIGSLYSRAEGNKFELGWDVNKEIEFIPVNGSGTGVQQILTLGAFVSDGSDGAVLLMEEPELHLHPASQETLMRQLREAEGVKHFFLTTHSPIVMQAAADTAVSLVRKNKEGMSMGVPICVEDMDDVLTDLGIRGSHFLVADVLVIVEGIYGVRPVEVWMGKWPALKELCSQLRIDVHPLNVSEVGSDDYDVGRIKGLNPNVVVFLDRDDCAGRADTPHEKLEKFCEKAGMPCVRVGSGKRRLEDLFPEEAIRSALPHYTEGWEYERASGLSPADHLAKHVGKWNDKWQKKWNRAVAFMMTVEQMAAEPTIRELMGKIAEVAKTVPFAS